MQGKQVQKIQTEVSTSMLEDDDDTSNLSDKSDLVKSILTLSSKYFKRRPKPNQINVILSHIAHETGRGKYVWNWNVGNIKKTGSDSFDYMNLGTFEYEDNKKVNKDAFFRSYKTLTDGVDDYLQLISKNSGAWTAIENGDPSGFAIALKKAGYYTAPLQDYERSMVNIYNGSGKKKIVNEEQARLRLKKRREILNKIYELIFSLERSINAHDDTKSIVKKGKYGN